RGTGLLSLERECFTRAVERLVERDLDGSLHVAATPPAAALRFAAEEILHAEPWAPAAAAGARALLSASSVSEDRPEEVREVAAVAEMLDAESPGPWTAGRRALGVPLPVGTERVVAPALLGIREHVVRFGDLPELVAVVLALGDVRMVLAREPPIGGLDGLVVGLPIDAENLVIVLVFDGHSAKSLQKV